MAEKMTRWGVGPMFASLSIIYGLFMIMLSRHFEPLLEINFIPHRLLATVGILLILIGIPFNIVAIVIVTRAFNAGNLVTGGIFGMCRHPLYAAWVVFIVPGIMLLVNSWIGLTTPPVMYFILRILVKKEEIYLEKMFGDKYLAYKKRVPAVLPIGWLKSNV